ncbi:MAG: O-antigen ligase family protein, partial [Planctomycetota bacterium]|nr:O-antigen ligase family protein [Planctomycetota bacterium]
LLLGGVIIAIILLVFIIRSQMSTSLNVRLDYWDATTKIIRDNLWNGVGLNQFGNHYLHYKSATAGEVTKAHNDYLQIASEMGIPALIIFLLIWFIILRSIIYQVNGRQRGSPSLTSTTTHSGSRPPPIYIGEGRGIKVVVYQNASMVLGVGFAFLLTEIFHLPLIYFGLPLLSTIIIFILWIFVFRFLSGYLTTNILNTNILRIGLFAGLLAFLIHCLVDFNFYVPGLSMSIWFLSAIFLVTSPKTPSAFPPNILPALLRVILIPIIAGILILLLYSTPRLMQYEVPFEEGRRNVRDNDREVVGKGMEELRESIKLNPYAVDPLLELGWTYHKHYCLSSDYENANKLPCIQYIDKAISLSPLSPMLYFQQGLLYKSHANSSKKNTRFTDIYQSRAKRSFQMVKELYPTYEDRK